MQQLTTHLLGATWDVLFVPSVLRQGHTAEVNEQEANVTWKKSSPVVYQHLGVGCRSRRSGERSARHAADVPPRWDPSTI